MSVDTRGLITIGARFISTEFDGVCCIEAADVDENTLRVLIQRIDDNGKVWNREEEWNLQHTVWGFEHGTYQFIN